MLRSSIAVAGLCLLVLPAQSDAQTERVLSTTSEPIPANPYRLTVAGNCKGMPVEVRYQRDSHGGHASVTVTVGRNHTHYGSDAPFVRDLFSNNAAYRFGITCGSMGHKEGLTLWAAGFSRMQGGQTQVVFGPGGKLVRYDGIDPMSDPLH
jgi:hypothetical protein